VVKIKLLMLFICLRGVFFIYFKPNHVQIHNCREPKTVSKTRFVSDTNYLTNHIIEGVG